MQIDPVTFVFELVNFLVLAFLLQRFVYRPVAAAITERRTEIAETRAQAAEKLMLVDQRATELDQRDREIDRLRETVLAEASADAAAERTRLIDQARQDANAERARVQTMLETEREAALGWVREVTVEHSVEVAGQLLLQLVPDAAHEALVGRLLAAVQEHPPASTPEHTIGVEATFARMPSSEQTSALKQALHQALGETPFRLAVSEDERLGAGATVRIRDRVYDASLAGQLDILREDARTLLEASA